MERPFDVAARAVNLLAQESEFAEGRELGVVEADRSVARLGFY
jgi:hypothetical protein